MSPASSAPKSGAVALNSIGSHGKRERPAPFRLTAAGRRGLHDMLGIRLDFDRRPKL